jgi:ribosomal peptide maturation radical SAM protein 1
VATDVVLVAMPWEDVYVGSLQVALLCSVLKKAGMRCETRAYYVQFIDYLAESSCRRLDGSPFTLADYRAVSNRFWMQGLGDWLFSPAAEDEERTAAYHCFLRKATGSEVAAELAGAVQPHVRGFVEKCAEDLIRSEARLVGFTTSFSQTMPALAVARRFKTMRPDSTVVLGGANCDGDMGIALAEVNPFIDVVVRGEGEQALVAVAEAVLSGQDIPALPGLSVRRGGQVMSEPGSAPRANLATNPTPDYAGYIQSVQDSPFRGIIRARMRLPFEAARGCWWGERVHCTFCGLNGSEIGFRSRPLQAVIDEILALSQKHHVLDFEAVDNILGRDFQHTVLPGLAEERRRGLDLSFFFEVKSGLHETDFVLLRDAGVTRIQPGIESLSRNILQLMRKGSTPLQHLRLLKWCDEFGITPTWNIIYGIPGEDPREYDRMAAMVPMLHHFHPPSLVPLAVQRFSPYGDQPEDHGLRVIGPAPFYEHLFEAPGDTLQRLAFVFSYDYAKEQRVSEYVAPLAEAVNGWENAHQAGAALRLEQGPGYVRIMDTRLAGYPVTRVLQGGEALAYLECGSGITPSELNSRLIAGGLDVTAAEVDAAVKLFLDTGLAVEESERILGLASRQRRMEDRCG